MKSKLLVLLAGSLLLKTSSAKQANTHAYATPTPVAAKPQVPPELEVPQKVFADQVVAGNFSSGTDTEGEGTHEQAAAAVELEDEQEDDRSPQEVLARNPIVQISQHIAHGLLDPSHDPPYVCRHSYSIEIVNRDPLLIYVRNFLQPGEAEHMIATSVPYMAHSMVASSENSTMKNTKDQQRTSSSAFMPRGGDAIMQCIEQRAADFVGVERSHVEGLQVVWYQKNQKYNPHFDYFPRDSDYYAAYTQSGGQRTHTFFVYLTDATYDMETGERVELEGGHTSFPKLGLSFPPIKDSAVFWTNMHIDGEEDERVLHGGDPVVRGQKMAINVWVREKPWE